MGNILPLLLRTLLFKKCFLVLLILLLLFNPIYLDAKIRITATNSVKSSTISIKEELILVSFLLLVTRPLESPLEDSLEAVTLLSEFLHKFPPPDMILLTPPTLSEWKVKLMDSPNPLENIPLNK